MTESELILADLVLLKIPINREFTQRGAYNDVLLGKQDNYDQNTLAEMNKVLVGENSVIIDFLLREKYINCTNQMHGRYLLREEGEIAQKHGGHKGYIAFIAEKNSKEEKEKVIQKKINWPQKNWLLLLIFAAIICPLIVELLQSSISKDKTQPQTPIQVVHDTIYIQDNRNQDTLKKKTSLTDTIKK